MDIDHRMGTEEVLWDRMERDVRRLLQIVRKHGQSNSDVQEALRRLQRTTEALDAWRDAGRNEEVTR